MSTSTSALTALPGSELTASDLVQVTDVSAGSSGTKKMTIAEFITGLCAQAWAFVTNITTTRGVASGTALKIGGLAYASTAASTAITGTTETETVFDTFYTLPANSLTAGCKLRIHAQGIHTSTTSSETHTMALKIGSVTLISKASIDPANNDIFAFDFDVVCRTAGASGTIVGHGSSDFGATATANPVTNYLASTTIDTTASNVIGVYIDRQSTATDSDSARLDLLTVEVVG